MSRFYVGQRVRIKFATTDDGVPCVGREATIASPAQDDGRYHLDVDGLKPPSGKAFWRALPEQLEPLTDSYDKTEWKDCLWQPEHEMAE